ncbi:Maf family protein [Bengtsoniella intestinalis]|uniref:Maf family protein n=1 Tax=Bengtsoniella intestinalis TaxID=3073143 RepID=UPI00391FAF19
MANIVLCSASPRRQELLQQMGIAHFDIRIPEVDESYPEGLTPQETVAHISRKKAVAAQSLCTENEIFITADTMVFCDHHRLGKPQNEADALAMLTALQGRTHQVCTAFTVGHQGNLITQTHTTDVSFCPCTADTLNTYIATGEPMDKAGSYGIQGYGGLLVDGIHGDYYTVMGLPIAPLGRVLIELGVTLF